MPLSVLERRKMDEWDRMIDVNINGVVYGIAAALPSMKAQKSGRCDYYSPGCRSSRFAAAAEYSGNKFAVHAIREGFRQEVKDYNIRPSNRAKAGRSKRAMIWRMKT